MKRRIESALMLGVVMVSGLAANERKLAKNVARRISRGTDGKGTANETGRVEMILPPTAFKVARFGHSSKGLAHVKNGAETQAACRQSSSLVAGDDARDVQRSALAGRHASGIQALQGK
jgi:hypothetical protein